MKRNARLVAVMFGLGVAGLAWATPKNRSAAGPEAFSAVRTQKAVGPNIYDTAVRTQKTVGPEASGTVRAETAVPQDKKRAGASPLLDLNAGF